MTERFCLVLLILPCWAQGDSGQSLPTAEVRQMASFTGKWKLLRLERGGGQMFLPAESVVATQKELRFDLGRNRGFTLTYRLCSGASSEHIDFVGGRKQFRGLYQLQGDVLKICWDENGGARPTELKTKPKTMLTLMILKRVK